MRKYMAVIDNGSLKPNIEKEFNSHKQAKQYFANLSNFRLYARYIKGWKQIK